MNAMRLRCVGNFYGECGGRNRLYRQRIGLALLQGGEREKKFFWTPTPHFKMSLKGLTGAVFGFANPKSIAWGIAEAWNRAGASVCIGIQSGRFAKGVAAATASWATPPLVFECDVTDDASVAAAFAAISQHTSGRLNFFAHSLAFAPAPAMQGSLLATTRGDFATAHAISAYSLLSLTRGALPLMQASGGGSVVALSYIGSQRAAKNYCVMGPAKASLEACARGLAAELGIQGIRINVISPGPINTLAARGISNFHALSEDAAKRSPLGRSVTQKEIGDTAVFLAGPLSSGITGQTLYVDAGFNAVV